MAVRQYIGARYVPLYAGDWDATRNYEPLTIVTDGNGNSYTSLRDVPAGTPLNNRNYWIITSSFSGAIEQLRRDLNTAQDDILELETDVTTIDGRIDVLENDKTINKVLLLCDSYGNYKNANNQNFAQIINAKTHFSVDQLALGSAGFGSTTKIYSLLNSYTGDKTKVSKIVFQCSANDTVNGVTDGQILAGMHAAKAIIDADYPNCKEVLIFAASTTFQQIAAVTAWGRRTMIESYIRNAGKVGFSFVPNSEWIMYNTKFMNNDRVHPNPDGVDRIAGYLIDALTCGSVDVLYQYSIVDVFTRRTDIFDRGDITGVFEFHNGIVSIEGGAANSFVAKLRFIETEYPALDYYGNTGVIELGTFDFSFGDIGAANMGWYCCPASVFCTTQKSLIMIARLQIVESKLSLLITAIGNDSTMGSIVQINSLSSNILCHVW